MATASFLPDGEGGPVEIFNPLTRAEERLTDFIFAKFNVVLSVSEAQEVIYDIIPYIQCFTSLEAAERCMIIITQRNEVSSE